MDLADLCNTCRFGCCSLWNHLQFFGRGQPYPDLYGAPRLAEGTIAHDLVERILGLASGLDRKSLKNQYTTFYNISREQSGTFAPITIGQIEYWLLGFEHRLQTAHDIFQRDGQLELIEAIVNDPGFNFDNGPVRLSGTEDGKAAKASILVKLVGRKDLADVALRQRERLAKFGPAHENIYPNVNVLVPTEQLVLNTDRTELMIRAKKW